MIDAPTLVITRAKALTLEGPPGPRFGAAMSTLRLKPDCDIFIRLGTIVAVEPSGTTTIPKSATTINAAGRIVMPGFIDCHTHACHAGCRIDEWELKLRGVPYLDILRAGGGIMATVRATRDCSPDDLDSLTRHRLRAMLFDGSTTVEVKSGYGLTAAAELHMLRSTARLAHDTSVPLPDIFPTALLGHAIEGEHDPFVHDTIQHTLPAVTAAFPGITIDAFCEVGSWTLADTHRLFDAASAAGHPLRLHADQFNSLGGVTLAIQKHARSVDHLEASTPDDLARLAASATIGVGLPICGFHLDGRYAKLRTLIDAGGAVAIASNFNPGSAPSWSIPLTMALAVRHSGLSPAEAISAATVNAAAALGLADRGRIEPGLRADLLVLHEADERSLSYAFGGDPIAHVVSGGNVVR